MESDSDSTDDVDEAEDEVCGTQDSNMSEPLSLSIKAIPTRKRRRPSEGKLAEYQYMRKRLSEEEMSILRVAFIKWYPTPPSNLQAQSRYEQQYGRQMSKRMIEGLWKRKLEPWSNRWWKFFQDFFDLAREKKKEKRADRDPTITKAEASAWSKEFHDKHGDADVSEEQSKSNGAEAADPSSSSKTRSGGASGSIKTRSAVGPNGVKTRSAGASKSMEVSDNDKQSSLLAVGDKSEISKNGAKAEGPSKGLGSDPADSAANSLASVSSDDKEDISLSASEGIAKADSRPSGKSSSELQKPIVKGKSRARKGGLRKNVRLVAISISDLNNTSSNLRSRMAAAVEPVSKTAAVEKESKALTDSGSVPLKIPLRRVLQLAANGASASPIAQPLRNDQPPAASAKPSASSGPPLRSDAQSGPKTASRVHNAPRLRSAPLTAPIGPILPPLRSAPKRESAKTSGNGNVSVSRSAPQRVLGQYQEIPSHHLQEVLRFLHQAVPSHHL